MYKLHQIRSDIAFTTVSPDSYMCISIVLSILPYVIAAVGFTMLFYRRIVCIVTLLTWIVTLCMYSQCMYCWLTTVFVCICLIRYHYLLVSVIAGCLNIIKAFPQIIFLCSSLRVDQNN